MYNIKLDEYNYYTGTYAKVGKVEGGIDLPSLPPTDNPEQAKCYQWSAADNNWSFDNALYTLQIAGAKKEDQKIKLQEDINVLKQSLSSSDYQIIKCQEYKLAGLEPPYDISVLSKKRQSLRDSINELEQKLVHLNNPE